MGARRSPEDVVVTMIRSEARGLGISLVARDEAGTMLAELAFGVERGPGPRPRLLCYGYTLSTAIRGQDPETTRALVDELLDQGVAYVLAYAGRSARWSIPPGPNPEVRIGNLVRSLPMDDRSAEAVEAAFLRNGRARKAGEPGRVEG